MSKTNIPMSDAPVLRSFIAETLRRSSKIMDSFEDGVRREIWITTAAELPPGGKPSKSNGTLVGVERGFFTLSEVVAQLVVNRKTIYGMIRRKEIKATKVGKDYRIPVGELERLRQGAFATKPPLNSSRR